MTTKTITVTQEDVEKTRRIMEKSQRYMIVSMICPVAQAARKLFPHKGITTTSLGVWVKSNGRTTIWQADKQLAVAIRDYDDSRYKSFRTGEYTITKREI